MKHRFIGQDNTHTHDGVNILNGTVVDLNATQAQAWADKFVAVPEEENTQGDQLRAHGPTIEEFVAAGYLAENYPPEGYAGVDSEGLTRYLETGSLDEPSSDGE